MGSTRRKYTLRLSISSGRGRSLANVTFERLRCSFLETDSTMYKHLVYLVLLCAFVASCDSSSSPGESSSLPQDMTALANTNWRLVAFYNSFGTRYPVTDTDRGGYTLDFIDSAKVSGKDNCNRFGGNYKAYTNKNLEIDSLQQTLRGCPDPHIEMIFALQHASKFELRDSTLFITTIYSIRKLEFEPNR